MTDLASDVALAAAIRGLAKFGGAGLGETLVKHFDKLAAFARRLDAVERSFGIAEAEFAASGLEPASKRATQH